MAITHNYFVIGGRTYKPEDISFGEAETLDLVINGGENGTMTTVPITKRQATLTAKGIVGDVLAEIDAERSNNISNLLRNQAETQTLNFGGYLIEDALLISFKPSAPQIVDGLTIFDSVELTYNSQVFS